MTWFYPPVYPLANTPASNEDINDSFYEIASALNGNLREHNWANGAMTLRSQVDTDAAYRIWYDRKIADHQVTFDPNLPYWLYPQSAGADAHIISFVEEWTYIRFDTKDYVEIETDDSPIWILFSGQWFSHEFDAVGVAIQIPRYDMHFGLLVDGRLIVDSCLAAFDQTNSDVTFFRQWSRPIAMEAVVPVGPGKHRVQAVVKSFYHWGGGAATDDIQEVQGRELIVIELRR